MPKTLFDFVQKKGFILVLKYIRSTQDSSNHAYFYRKWKMLFFLIPIHLFSVMTLSQFIGLILISIERKITENMHLEDTIHVFTCIKSKKREINSRFWLFSNIIVEKELGNTGCAFNFSNSLLCFILALQ